HHADWRADRRRLGRRGGGDAVPHRPPDHGGSDRRARDERPMSVPESAPTTAEEVDEIGRMIAEYVVGLEFGDLPTEVVDQSLLAITDTIGVALAGLGQEPTRSALKSTVPDRGESLIWGTALRRDPVGAALVNGTM